MAALDEALAWDRGPFMEGFALRDSEAFDEWQAAEGEAHRRDLAGALERLARARAAERRWDLATDVTRRWLEVDPLHEPAHQLMISALARSGEVAGAIAQYRDLVRTLDRELGVAPLPETSELADAVRDGRLGPDRGATRPSQPPETHVYGLPAGGDTLALPLIGRDADVARLVAAAAGVGPDGQLLVIEGEAGIGKTRLAEAVVAAIRDAGGTVLEARTVAGESTIPFAVIAELIRSGSEEPGVADRIAAMPSRWQADAARLSPLPGVTTTPPGSTAGTDPYGRLRLLESLSGALAALAEGPRGGLIWVDDIDRADPSSAEVVAYLARRLHRRRVAILLSGRFESADAPEVPPSLALALRDADVRIHLERLGRSDVTLLAERTLGARATSDVVDALLAETEGLPLYVAEALAAPDSIGGSVPGGMLALLRSRIASVDEVGRQVLAGAAVIGRSFDLETVRAAAGRGRRRPSTGSRHSSGAASSERSNQPSAMTCTTISRTVGSATWPTRTPAWPVAGCSTGGWPTPWRAAARAGPMSRAGHASRPTRRSPGAAARRPWRICAPARGLAPSMPTRRLKSTSRRPSRSDIRTRRPSTRRSATC